jgi:hypothetical protein
VLKKQCSGSGSTGTWVNSVVDPDWYVTAGVYIFFNTPHRGRGGVLAEDTWGKNVKKREEEEGQIRKIKQKEKIDIKRMNKCKRGGK